MATSKFQLQTTNSLRTRPSFQCAFCLLSPFSNTTDLGSGTATSRWLFTNCCCSSSAWMYWFMNHRCLLLYNNFFRLETSVSSPISSKSSFTMGNGLPLNRMLGVITGCSNSAPWHFFKDYKLYLPYRLMQFWSSLKKSTCAYLFQIALEIM